ncbi:unnamed protein product [Discosporangium mesarthrocarpum]
MSLLPAVGESLVSAFVAIPAAWAVHQEIGRDDMAVGLGLCVIFASMLRVRYDENRGKTPSTTIADDEESLSPNGEESVRVFDSSISSPKLQDNTVEHPAINTDDGPRRDIVEGLTAHVQSKRAGLTKKRQYMRGGEFIYVVRGLADGAVGLVRDPVKGVQDDGVKGFVKGLGTGVVGVVGRPMLGVLRAGGNTFAGMKSSASMLVGASRGSSKGKVRQRLYESSLEFLPSLWSSLPECPTHQDGRSHIPVGWHSHPQCTTLV